jgi:predicted unusual protein kinase regulating ubiquinone biosynthesis (AarF/ABC1/UbiB family)
MIARRTGDQAYLDGFAAAGHDLDRIVRRLDWNMLNQVFVFGYFHADLHPANIFVLPGDAIGYVDFGIVGQLPNRVRQSLTRYSWLLFRGEIEAAVSELMRWLAPTTTTDAAAARWKLIRVHQTFLYDATADRSRMTSDAPGPIVASRENPYSRLAVDILETVREHRLSMSPNIVGYLKMLVTLGALRHELAINYDLPDTVRRFVRRLTRQQGLSLLDPRLAMERLYAGGGQVQRALNFVEFLEGQEPTILEAEALLFGFRRRMQSARKALVRLGGTVLAIGAVLYLVTAYPDDTRRVLPAGVEYTWVQIGLLGLLILLIVWLINFVRGLGKLD